MGFVVKQSVANHSWWESPRWNWTEDFWGVRTQVEATTVCATGSVHTLLPHAHFLCVAYRWHTHALAQGSSVCKKVFCSACVFSPSRPLYSHVSPTVLAVPWRSLLLVRCFSSFARPKNRGACAVPHERWRVCLFGRFRALHRTACNDLKTLFDWLKHTKINLAQIQTQEPWKNWNRSSNKKNCNILKQNWNNEK